MTGTFDDHGIRFRYPEDWDVEVTDEGSVTTVAIHSPGDSPAFALITVDENRPDPNEIADQALEAMREEYPQLDAVPGSESLSGHEAIGHDVEFFTLDLTNSCTIRCFRTKSRTVLLFGQCSDIEGEDTAETLAAVRRSLEVVE